jgi:NDP-mannose synthase
MSTALIQAGGKSQRMRRDSGAAHKALLPVLGVPLLERNLCKLLATGFERIAVVTSPAEAQIVDYVATRGAALARSRGAQLECFAEEHPLGTIGAAAFRGAPDCPILVVYSDNLTSIDLRALVDRHEKAQAAITLATHDEPFQIPFGEVVCRDGRVIDYREKSVHPIRISSGLYVLGSEALDCIARGERVDSPQLVLRLLERGALIAEYLHSELWIDMNDALGLAQAERLIAQNHTRLDWLSNNSDRQGCLLVSTFEGQIYSALDERNEANPSAADATILGSFDEIDPGDGRIVRWQVELCSEKPESRSTVEWLSPLEAMSRGASRHRRALAYAAYHLAGAE